MPWLAGIDTPGRLSATLINAQMAHDPSGLLPVYSYYRGGVVLRPEHGRVLCAYERDAVTNKRDCPSPSDDGGDGGGVSQGSGGAGAAELEAELEAERCVPGCTPTHLHGWRELGQRYWCARRGGPDGGLPEAAALVNGSALEFGPFACPWRPGDLEEMIVSWAELRRANHSHCGARCERARARLSGAALEAYEDLVLGRYYNEVVIERAAVVDAIPLSIEAVYYPSPVAVHEVYWRMGQRCPELGTAGGCVEVARRTAALYENVARATHAALRRAFPHSSGAIPLVVLNLSERWAPFRVAPQRS